MDEGERGGEAGGAHEHEENSPESTDPPTLASSSVDAGV
jgi:hypothetical protein